MAISLDSINAVKNAINIIEVVSQFVTLKQKGAQHTGLCPFHNEKSGSFTVSASKAFYKCFGCGESGNAISFIMKHNRKTYPEAIEWLADKYSITLEYDATSNKMSQETKDKLAEMHDINMFAANLYSKTLMLEQDKNSHVWQELTINRALTEETIVKFKLGYAPLTNDQKYLATFLLEAGRIEPAKELGLVASQGESKDKFLNRIMFPIEDLRGQVIGFGGRSLSDDKKYAKYLNSQESDLYKKSTVLYGLNHAADAIRKAKCAHLVEGFLDVISMHQADVCNTVGTCGTAFTDDHARLLKRHTDTVILIGDGDSAGLKANLKAIDVLILHGFNVMICPLPDGHDPDSFARTFEVIQEAELVED